MSQKAEDMGTTTSGQPWPCGMITDAAVNRKSGQNMQRNATGIVLPALKESCPYGGCARPFLVDVLLRFLGSSTCDGAGDGIEIE
jgi:hypothetical protein